MVNWYKNLYVGDTAKKKQKKWMRRIENKKAVPGVWLLTLPSNQQNNLDVIPADLLLQPAVRRNCPMIVGLAVSREEAFELVEAIALETYRETGEVKIREWLLNRIDDTYTIHDFEGTGGFAPCFTGSRASYRLHRPVSSFLLPGAGSERRRGICLRKSERKSIVAFRSCRADGLV